MTKLANPAISSTTASSVIFSTCPNRSVSPRKSRIAVKPLQPIALPVWPRRNDRPQVSVMMTPTSFLTDLLVSPAASSSCRLHRVRWQEDDHAVFDIALVDTGPDPDMAEGTSQRG
ncbi:MAG: hypothetical protein MZV63_46120 [Marinilabiliales bacterium]|nr:hypothetical protein [Marinilabiliales bacterium]